MFDVKRVNLSNTLASMDKPSVLRVMLNALQLKDGGGISVNGEGRAWVDDEGEICFTHFTLIGLAFQTERFSREGFIRLIQEAYEGG